MIKMKKLLLIFAFCFAGLVNAQTPDYIELFEERWVSHDSVTAYGDASQGPVNNRFSQDIYYWGWYVKGLYKMWVVTGEERWLNNILEMAHIMMNKSVLMSTGEHYNWPGYRSPNDYPDGVPLWVSYSWREITNVLRVMYESPVLRSTAHGQSGWAGTTYQDEYNYILAWTENNVWDYFYSQSINNIYRVFTHMTSHWALIAMNLHIMTDKTIYKTVYDNIVTDGFPSNSKYPGARFSDQFFFVDSENQSWYWDWDQNTVQDTDHSSDVVEFYVESYENGYGIWDKSDLVSFSNTYNNLQWFNNNIPIEGRFLIDGSYSSKESGVDPKVAGYKSYGWYMTAAHNPELMSRLESVVTVNNSWFSIRTTMLGSLAWAQNYGSHVYPEANSTSPNPVEPANPNLPKADIIRKEIEYILLSY
tara:strand:+ start:4900 stop:6153 length:1254 start_codon:yes stop_codon:yes gene_type:complete